MQSMHSVQSSRRSVLQQPLLRLQLQGQLADQPRIKWAPVLRRAACQAALKLEATGSLFQPLLKELLLLLLQLKGL